LFRQQGRMGEAGGGLNSEPGQDRTRDGT
jgi:hypothetical protein